MRERWVGRRVLRRGSIAAVAAAVLLLVAVSGCGVDQSSVGDASPPAATPAQGATSSLTTLQEAAAGCGVSGGQVARHGGSMLTSNPDHAGCVAAALGAPAEVTGAIGVDGAGTKTWPQARMQWSRAGDMAHYGFALPDAQMPQVADAAAQGAQGTGSGSPAPPAGMTAAEAEYVRAAADVGEDDEATLRKGKERCAHVGKMRAVTDRARYIVETRHDPEQAITQIHVTYLCAGLTGAYTLAQRALTDGTYTVVAADSDAESGRAQVGTYRTDRGITDCYWERSSSSGATIANDFITNAPAGATVTLRAGEGFTSQGCGVWLPTR